MRRPPAVELAGQYCTESTFCYELHVSSHSIPPGLVQEGELVKMSKDQPERWGLKAGVTGKDVTCDKNSASFLPFALMDMSDVLPRFKVHPGIANDLVRSVYWWDLGPLFLQVM